jgi:hypothetical protein
MGKIFKRQFNGEKLTQLADSGFGNISHFELSPNGRFILYTGYPGSFIYDTKKNENNKLPTNSVGINIRFSPDGESVVWVDERPPERPTAFEVFNLIDHSLISVPYPAEAQNLHDYRSTDVRWSLDGKDVYLGAIAYPTGAYFKYNFQDRKITKIDGRYQSWNNDGHNEGFGIHFSEAGKELPFYKPPCMQWQCVARQLVAPKQEDHEGGKPMKGESRSEKFRFTMKGLSIGEA